MIEEVRKIVEKECTSKKDLYDIKNFNWDFHILIVVKYAKLLSKKLNSDEELAELGALLHDIGRVKFGGKYHEKTGISEAEKILKDVGYSQDVINEIKHCVESHRGNENTPTKTTTAKIVANADALAHFDVIPLMLEIGIRKYNGDIRKGADWLYDKMKRNWDKKITLPEARELVKDKYEAFMILFDSYREIKPSH
ncbi:MAG: HD domain-containing protein [Candidatus Aenigmatarchaeota archaeon]